MCVCQPQSPNLSLPPILLGNRKFSTPVTLDSTYKRYHMIFVFAWLTSLSTTTSRSIHVAANDIISFFFTVLSLHGKNLFVSYFLKCQKTSKTTATRSVGPHEITLPKSWQRDKELGISQKKERKKERKRRAEGRGEGKRGKERERKLPGRCEQQGPFLALTRKAGGENPLGLHSHRVHEGCKGIDAWDKKYPSVFFFFKYNPSSFQTPVQEIISAWQKVLGALLTDRQSGKKTFLKI